MQTSNSLAKGKRICRMHFLVGCHSCSPRFTPDASRGFDAVRRALRKAQRCFARSVTHNCETSHVEVCARSLSKVNTVQMFRILCEPGLQRGQELHHDQGLHGGWGYTVVEVPRGWNGPGLLVLSWKEEEGCEGRGACVCVCWVRGVRSEVVRRVHGCTWDAAGAKVKIQTVTVEKVTATSKTVLSHTHTHTHTHTHAHARVYTQTDAAHTYTYARHTHTQTKTKYKRVHTRVRTHTGVVEYPLPKSRVTKTTPLTHLYRDA